MSANTDTTGHVSRLLQLPVELQQRILEHVVHPFDIDVCLVRQPDDHQYAAITRIHCSRTPHLETTFRNLRRTCKHFSAVLASLRSRQRDVYSSSAFLGTLTLYGKPDYGQKDSFFWLRQRSLPSVELAKTPACLETTKLATLTPFVRVLDWREPFPDSQFIKASTLLRALPNLETVIVHTSSYWLPESPRAVTGTAADSVERIQNPCAVPGDEACIDTYWSGQLRRTGVFRSWRDLLEWMETLHTDSNGKIAVISYHSLVHNHRDWTKAFTPGFNAAGGYSMKHKLVSSFP